MQRYSGYLGQGWKLLMAALSVASLAACAAGYGGGYQDGYRGGYYGDRGHAQERQEVARQAYERDLERRVAAVLDADPRTKINGLKVTSQGDGVVMISGSPANGIMGRDLALRAASRVPGVRSVANNMTMN